MRTITTESGSEYTAKIENGRLLVRREGQAEWSRAIAVFEDRLPFLEATVRWTREGEFLCGYNDKGNRTVRLVPSQVRKGMVLWSPQGLRSTEIVKIEVQELSDAQF
jgi:hypothetical protein